MSSDESTNTNANPNDRTGHRHARRAALWLLYVLDTTGGEAHDILATSRATVEDLQPELAEHFGLLRERFLGVARGWDAINGEVQKVSPRWKIDRMAIVDRNILRLGAWEILHGKIPPLETINECVELAKDYGSKNTPGFVNGLLDQLCKDHGIPIKR